LLINPKNEKNKGKIFEERQHIWGWEEKRMHNFGWEGERETDLWEKKREEERREDEALSVLILVF